eukprot:TRINITY_DN242_c0_g1_i1.p1 TRINITY_DN242_c0_g1~~TRINITY_DN242_c0_g1_i1.p1  ORF type:complete len:373 (+),score=62.44 TRINITY_DN242_c0_g1_i1:121-1239(+)
MKLLISLFILALTIFCVHAQSCTMDYQCKTAPYGQCTGSLDDCPTTFGGVAIDEDNNLIYYAARCRNISDDTFNVVVKKIGTNGGVPTTVFSEFLAPGPGNIDKIFTVVNGVLYIDRAQRQPGSLLSSYNIQSSQKSSVSVGPGFFQRQLDVTNGASYTCQLEFGINNNYSIVRFSGIVGQTASSTGNKLYTIGSSQCGPVRRGTGSDIIFTVYSYTTASNAQTTSVTYTTTFYKGTVTGSATLPSPLFSVNGQVDDFDVDKSGNAIIYGTHDGLFKRVGASTTTLSNEPVTGVYIYNQKIFYNNGMTIRSTTLKGESTQNLIQQTTGQCTCRPNFSGSNCQTCKGQIQWNNGIPSCVPVCARNMLSRLSMW